MTMPSLEELMKMAEAAKAQLDQAQANLDKVEVEGVSGGGLVKIKATAKGRILGVSIDDSLLVPAQGGCHRRRSDQSDDRRHAASAGFQLLGLTSAFSCLFPPHNAAKLHLLDCVSARG